MVELRDESYDDRSLSESDPLVGGSSNASPPEPLTEGRENLDVRVEDREPNSGVVVSFSRTKVPVPKEVEVSIQTSVQVKDRVPSPSSPEHSPEPGGSCDVSL